MQCVNKNYNPSKVQTILNAVKEGRGDLKVLY